MEAEAFVNALKKQGFELEVSNGMVLIGPKSKLTAELKQEIRTRKDEILGVLERGERTMIRPTPSDEKGRVVARGTQTTRPEIIDSVTLISSIIQDIDRFYASGAISWLKHSQPDRWRDMQRLEKKINQKAAERDVDVLRQVLEEWRGFLKTAVQDFVRCHGEDQEESGASIYSP